MLRLSELKDVVRTQREKITSERGFTRDLLHELEILSGFALVISGIRRCGKSTLLAQLMHRQKRPSLVINFDSPKLYQFQFDDFRLLDELIKERPNLELLFFDEIQIVKGWEVYVRGKLDEGYDIVITGSNASLLSRELGTKLTGRHITKELYPFSFKEFCAYGSMNQDAEATKEYLQIGGFPQYVKTKNPEILNTLINDLLYRDISVRFNIRNDQPLKNLLMFCVGNVGNLISANKLAPVIGVKSVATVQEYLGYLEDTYLINTVSKFSWSYKKQLVNPRKIYFIDNGLHQVVSPSANQDMGRKFENMVYWELKRQTKEIFYFKENNHECDFVLCKNNQPQTPIQVCYDLNPDNSKREIDGLLEAMTFFNIPNGYLISLNQTDKIITKDKTINILPFYQVNQFTN